MIFDRLLAVAATAAETSGVRQEDDFQSYAALVQRIERLAAGFSSRGLKEGDVVGAWPGASYTLKVSEQYRNMKVVLDQHPQIVENAVEAIRRAGMTPVRGSIRGGTDGSRLSFMGLPCANIFAGGHAFHSPLEFVSSQDMEKAVTTIVELAKLWEERA